MKKVTTSRRLQLDINVVRRLDDLSLTKVEGAGYTMMSCPSRVVNLCTSACVPSIPCLP
jgi:hypothetical protein